MQGMIFTFGNEATVEVAAEEYALSSGFDEYWYECDSELRRMARLVSVNKGISEEEAHTFLTRSYGAPQFRSPAQRRWWFATHPGGKPEESESKGSPSKDRWAEIMEAARNSLKGQPRLTGDELVSVINTIVDPDLTESEGGRVRRLVAPERKQKLVGPPEKIPLELRTPETKELIEQEQPRIQKEREEEREKRKERSKPPVRVKKSPGAELSIPPFAQPGMPMMGIYKRLAVGPQSYPGEEIHNQLREIYQKMNDLKPELERLTGIKDDALASLREVGDRWWSESDKLSNTVLSAELKEKESKFWAAQDELDPVWDEYTRLNQQAEGLWKQLMAEESEYVYTRGASIPLVWQPEMIALTGASKKGYIGKKEFFLDQFQENADADHWRAFSQAVVLVRSGVDTKDIEKTVNDEYPEVCADEVLKAAKDFMKRGQHDPYIRGVSEP